MLGVKEKLKKQKSLVERAILEVREVRREGGREGGREEEIVLEERRKMILKYGIKKSLKNI